MSEINKKLNLTTVTKEEMQFAIFKQPPTVKRKQVKRLAVAITRCTENISLVLCTEVLHKLIKRWRTEHWETKKSKETQAELSCFRGN